MSSSSLNTIPRYLSRSHSHIHNSVLISKCSRPNYAYKILIASSSLSIHFSCLLQELNRFSPTLVSLFIILRLTLSMSFFTVPPPHKPPDTCIPGCYPSHTSLYQLCHLSFIHNNKFLLFPVFLSTLLCTLGPEWEFTFFFWYHKIKHIFLHKSGF